MRVWDHAVSDPEVMANISNLDTHLLIRSMEGPNRTSRRRAGFGLDWSLDNTQCSCTVVSIIYLLTQEDYTYFSALFNFYVLADDSKVIFFIYFGVLIHYVTYYNPIQN